MHKCGYDAKYFANYVDSGGLPRLIRRTLEHYKALIESVIQALRSYSEGSWKDSYAQAMLQHWANKLANTRKRAIDYRDHVIESYIVLRDADKKKFQDESFHRLMWKRFESLEASIIANGNVNARNPNTPLLASNMQCGHCKHRIGHETAACPLHEYKSAHASSLLKDLVGKSKCLKAISVFKNLVNANDTETAITAAIAMARAQALALVS